MNQTRMGMFGPGTDFDAPNIFELTVADWVLWLYLLGDFARAEFLISAIEPEIKVMNATQVVHWPGKDTPACDDHAAKLFRLAAVLGFQLSSTPCEEQSCVNCENEKKGAQS